MRWALLQLAVLLLFISGAQAEKRVALVIGNSTYQNTAALINPRNDAEDMASTLKQVGFEVIFDRDLDKRRMEKAIARFARAARNADAALFYYAGHGMQHRGLNYLMPTEAKLEDEFSLSFEMTRLEDVLTALHQVRGVKILVLDACRNNPLADRLMRASTTRDFVSTRGLAKIDASRGMVVAYATQADQVAIDGTGRNSPFTSALVKQIKEPGLEIGTLFRRVAAEVNKVTGGRQLPELSVSLLGEFYFTQADSDVQVWAKIRASGDTVQFKDFVSRYPASPLVTDARERLAAIEQTERARVERTRAEQERIERGRLAREKVERERLERERLAREQAERKDAERAKIERERVAREQAERERLERDKREQADQKKNAENSQFALLTPSVEPPPTASESATDSCIAEAMRLEQIAKHGSEVRKELGALANGAKCEKVRIQARARLAALDQSSTEAPATDKKSQGQFDGSWSIAWTGVTNCRTPSGSYAITIRNGSLIGKQSGHVSASGAARWRSTSRFGQRVDYTGLFKGGSGSGRFQNENGCQGTFVARKGSEIGDGGGPTKRDLPKEKTSKKIYNGLLQDQPNVRCGPPRFVGDPCNPVYSRSGSN